MDELQCSSVLCDYLTVLNPAMTMTCNFDSDDDSVIFVA